MIQTANLKLEKYELNDAANLVDGYNRSMDILDGFGKETKEHFPIQSFDIENGAITNDKIANGAITSNKIATAAITTDKIDANAVTADKIPDGAITADKISPDALVSSIPEDGIKSDMIAEGAITSEKIADDSITSEKIVNGSITSEKIVDGSITLSKIDSSIIDDIPTKDSGNLVKSGGIYNEIISIKNVLAGNVEELGYFQNPESNINQGYYEGGLYGVRPWFNKCMIKCCVQVDFSSAGNWVLESNRLITPLFTHCELDPSITDWDNLNLGIRRSVGWVSKPYISNLLINTGGGTQACVTSEDRLPLSLYFRKNAQGTKEAPYFDIMLMAPLTDFNKTFDTLKATFSGIEKQYVLIDMPVFDINKFAYVG